MKARILFEEQNKEITFICFPWLRFKKLYRKIDRTFDISKTDVQTCTRFFQIDIGEKLVTPQDNYKVALFIRRNNLNPLDIKGHRYEYCGIGGGDFINDKLKIEIRASESKHDERPHIHISNCKGGKPVVFALWNLEILKGGKNWDNTFKPKERRNVMEMLKESKDEFARFYRELSLGYVPEKVIYHYDGKEYCFFCKNETR